MDFPHAFDIGLRDCDLKGNKELNFAKRSDVCLNDIPNLPSHLDVSMCRYVNLYNSDLKGIEQLKFSGSRIILERAKNLPTTLDLSGCSNDGITLSNNCRELLNVKKLILVGKKQLIASKLNLPEDWQGELIFADEERVQTNEMMFTHLTKNGLER